MGARLAIPVALMAVSVTSLFGCESANSGGGPLSPRALVSHEQWTRAALETDAFPSHQPPTIDCGIAGFFVENGAVEMNTNSCNYVLISHPTTVSAPAGTELRLSLQHYDLESPEPATAHIAISFRRAGEAAVVEWETSLDIPRTANVIITSWRSTRALRAGDEVQIHLHNHGQNSYQLVRLVAMLPSS